MAVKTIRLIPSKAPALPIAPNQYDIAHFDIFSRILRLYFNQIDNLFESLLGVTGTKTLRSVYGSFYDTSAQTAPAATITPITINTTAVASDTYIGTPTSRVYVTNAGVYNIQFSLQLANSGTGTPNIDNVTVWFRLNGVDIPNSASIIEVQPRRGSVDGHMILALNFMLELNATDYFELYWTTDTGTTGIITYASPTTPPLHPAAPAVILTVSFVSALAN